MYNLLAVFKDAVVYFYASKGAPKTSEKRKHHNYYHNLTMIFKKHLPECFVDRAVCG